MHRRKYIVGNWKMNGTARDLHCISAIADHARQLPSIDVALCPPATLLSQAGDVAHGMAIGAQDCHADKDGPRTGCLSAAMLADAGATVCIVGHSERRAEFGETDASTLAKAAAAQGAGMSAIVCVGESASDHAAGRALERVLAQLAGSVPPGADPAWLSVAYEPVWAVGTGVLPTLAELGTMHAAIRAALETRFGEPGQAFRILYGGSMTGDNALALLAVPNVDGGLIGGASLTAEAFSPILETAAAVG